MKHLALVIDWYGPYTYNEGFEASKDDYSAGLYVGMGKCLSDSGPSKPQYIGISKDLWGRLKHHHKLPEITGDTKLWLGEVANFEPPGKRRKSTSTSLDYAEWLHAYFLQLPLNTKKKINPPDRSVTVLNRWWKKDYETPWVKRPHPLWPDLIDFIDVEYPAKAVWFGKNQKRFKPPFLLGK